MRLLDIFSRHPHGDISAHADGELAPGRRDALEAHLAGCQGCRTELDELLAVRSALRDLPQVAAPRSFALTPAMAEREPAPVTSRTTPAYVAMRLAGAGFAAVLAVVVMLDAGGIVDDNGSRSSDESASLGFLETDTANGAVEPYGLRSGDDAGAPSTGGDGDLPASGGGGGFEAVPNSGGGVGDAPDSDVDPAFGPLPNDIEQDPRVAPITSGDGNEISGNDDGKAAAPESGDGAPTAFASDDDGVSSLLVIEIGLAAIAVIAIGGSFVMRRRVESD